MKKLLLLLAIAAISCKKETVKTETAIDRFIKLILQH